MNDFLQTNLLKVVVSHASFKLASDDLDGWEQLQKSRIQQRWEEIKEWFDIRGLVEENFLHCDNVKPSLFTPMKMEDDEIIDLYEIFKEVLQPTFDLNIGLSNMIEFVWQDQVEETPTIIDMIMLINIKDKNVLLKEILAMKIKLIGNNIERDLAKDFRGLRAICPYKTSPFSQSAISPIDIDEQGCKCKLQDAFILHFKFHPYDKLEGELYFRRGRLMLDVILGF